MLDPLQYSFQVLCNGMKTRFRMIMIAHPGRGIGFHKQFMWQIIILPTVGNSDCHYIPGLPIERPMTSPPSYDSSPRQNSSYINHGHKALARAAPLQSVVVRGRPVDSVTHLSPLALDHQAWMILKVPWLGPTSFALE